MREISLLPLVVYHAVSETYDVYKPDKEMSACLPQGPLRVCKPGEDCSSPPSEMPALSLFCLLSDNSALCLGGHPPSDCALLIILLPFAKSACHCKVMSSARFWPGVVKFGPFVYIFGGKDAASNALASSERFSALDVQWHPLPPMNYRRAAFSPCIFTSVIYLAEASEKRKPFEAFNPVTEQYRKIPIHVTEKRFIGSVAFVADDALIFISRSGRIGKWNLRDAQSAPSLGTFPLVDPNLALSSCSPVRVGDEVFWMHVQTGNRVAFNLRTNALD